MDEWIKWVKWINENEGGFLEIEGPGFIGAQNRRKVWKIHASYVSQIFRKILCKLKKLSCMKE